MAKGDAYAVLSAAVSNNSFLDLIPASGELVVHNVYTPEGSAYELYWYNGSTAIKFDHDAAIGRANVQFHCTATKYVRIKNTSGANADLGADGMYTA